MANDLQQSHSEVRMMNYRLQLSPISSTHDSMPLRQRWSVPAANWEDAKFFRSWLVYDSGLEPNRTPGITWNSVLGLALAIAVSACFWAGIGLMIARAWK